MRMHLHRLKGVALAASMALTLFAGGQAALAATANPGLEGQVLAAVNADRAAAGLPALAVDPRLTAVAEARAEYMIAHGFFSHCSGGEADTSCRQSGYDFLPREQAAGISIDNGGKAGENIALNNYGAGSAAGQTNTDWMNSPEHKANIMVGGIGYTGVGVACCYVGTINGQPVAASDNVSIYVQEFTGGPGAVPPSSGAAPASGAGCRFVLGFADIAGMLPGQVGQCAGDETHNPSNGDALQHTSTGGMLVWRKADNWTAFTDGFHSWINGPYGLRERLNSQRFSWEANPDGLAVAR